MASFNNITSKTKQSFFDIGDYPFQRVTTEDKVRAHSGNGFWVTSLNTSLNSGVTHVVAFSTPTSSGSQIHLNVKAAVKADTDFRIWEGSVVTPGGGSSINVFCTQRELASICQTRSIQSPPVVGKITVHTLSTGISITSDGTLIHQETIGLAGVNEPIGELILKSNTTYVVELISRAASNRVGITLGMHQV